MKFAPTLTIGIIVGIIFTTIAFFVIPSFTSEKVSNKSQLSDGLSVPDRPVFPVTVDITRQITFEERLQATGRARACREAPVIPQISGIVTEVLVRDGMRVIKGQPLFRIDDREYLIALREAEDRLLERRIEYNLMKAGPSPDPSADPGLKDLVKELEFNYNESREALTRGEITDRDLIHIKREYESTLAYLHARREEVIANKSGLTMAEQAYERAKLNLSHTEVRAPYDGYIAQIDIQEGMMAQTGREYLKVVDLFTIHIEAGIIESELPRVKEGASAHLRFPALGDRTFKGSVYAVSPLIDPETKTARVTITLPNPGGSIKAGMFANVEIITDVIENALVVPRHALLVRDRRELVFCIDNNIAKWHYVETGRKNQEYVEILGGITEGDTIAVGGHYTLAHDARVKTIE